MRVLICEPNVVGHFLHYASLTATALQDVTDDVVIGLSSKAPDTYWYDHFVAPLSGRTEILATHDATKLRESSLSARVRNSLAEWVFLQRYIKDVKPDHVILPTANRVGNALVWLPKATTRGAEIEMVQHNSILGRRTATAGRLEAWLRPLLVPRAAAVTRVHFTDETQYGEARRLYPTLAPKFSPLADPVEVFDVLPRDDARRILGLPLPGRIVLMISPTPYKGAMPLLDLFRAGKAPVDCRLVLVGQADERVEQYVQQHLQDQCATGQVVLLKGRSDEADLHQAVCAADVIVPRLTPMHGTSAMCLRAALAGRRFFSASSPWMDMMAQLGFGDCVTDRRPDALAAAFSRALDRSSQPISPDLVERLRRIHSPANFMDGISARVRERVGLRPRLPVPWGTEP